MHWGSCPQSLAFLSNLAAQLKLANALSNILSCILSTEHTRHICLMHTTCKTLGDAVLSDFWKHYCKQFSNHPVAKDIQESIVDPRRLVPLNLHGDGGRTFKKSELMVLQYQSCIGRGTRLSTKSRKRKLGQHEAAQVNLKGHSLSTRYLLSVMTKKHYMEDVSPLLELLGLVSDWFAPLYRHGLVLESGLWRFIPLGMKGDLVFQAKAAGLTRMFSRVRKKAPNKKSKPLKGCCCWCLAGTPSINFESFDENPVWLSTMWPNNPMPWTTTPTMLRAIPHSPDQASFLKADAFHILNMGVFKEFAGSALALLLPSCGGTSNEECMASMNARLREFRKEKKVQIHVQKLTLELIGASTPGTYTCGGWNKGQDSIVFMEFAEWLTCKLPVDVAEKPWKYIYEGCRNIHLCMHTLYSEGAFMPCSSALEASSQGHRFLLCYSKLVEYSIEQGKLHFNLTPKCHYLHHILVDLAQAARKEGVEQIFNPICNSTSQCEDFIGNISRLSRRVSPKLPHARVLRRYQAALADRMGLLG